MVMPLHRHCDCDRLGVMDGEREDEIDGSPLTLMTVTMAGLCSHLVHTLLGTGTCVVSTN